MKGVVYYLTLCSLLCHITGEVRVTRHAPFPQPQADHGVGEPDDDEGQEVDQDDVDDVVHESESVVVPLLLAGSDQLTTHDSVLRPRHEKLDTAEGQRENPAQDDHALAPEAVDARFQGSNNREVSIDADRG